MKTVPSTLFRSAILDAGFVPNEILPALDSMVNCPSRDWLEKDFSMYLAGIKLPGMGESSDCDDWAFFAKSMAGFANGYTDSKAGVAFGVAKITIYPQCSFNGIPGPGLHLTNAVLLDTGELVAYEPQTQTVASFKDSVADGSIGVDWILY